MNTEKPPFEQTEETPNRGKIIELLEREKETIKMKAVESGLLVYRMDGSFDYALAPNGERSSLNDRQWIEVRTNAFKKWFGDWEHDAERASKILDGNCEPRVVFHGTQTVFTEFLKKGKFKGVYFAENRATAKTYTGQHNITPGKTVLEHNRELDFVSAKMWKEKARNSWFFWMRPTYKRKFRESLRSAYKRTPVILEAYLNVRNPLVIDNSTEVTTKAGMTSMPHQWQRFEEDVKHAKGHGHDGIVWHESDDGGIELDTVYNVFRPDQAKSALENNGFFDGDNADINQ